MATLTDDELARIKAEVLDNVLDQQATPWFDVRAIYEVLRDNVRSSSVSPTTSATAVTAPGPTVLTLASATGYVAGQKVQLDCDAARETVTIRAVVGSTISVICRKTHGGTYPVEVESPLTLVRGVLSDLAMIETGAALDALDAVGLKQVDEVVFRDDETITRAVARARNQLRERLASLCGLGFILSSARSGGNTVVY